jgi:hypothetical protein
MMVTAFWDMAPCSIVEVGRRFRRAYFLHLQGDERERARERERERDSLALYPRSYNLHHDRVSALVLEELGNITG